MLYLTKKEEILIEFDGIKTRSQRSEPRTNNAKVDAKVEAMVTAKVKAKVGAKVGAKVVTKVKAKVKSKVEVKIRFNAGSQSRKSEPETKSYMGYS